MSNVDSNIVDYQRRCIARYLPKDWTFRQHLTEESHAASITKCVAESRDDIVIILDIDCIPLRATSLRLLKHFAAKSILVGAVQRANHINNDSHLYVGPFCMSFSRTVYDRLERPSFSETDRGDVGEELTYCWQNSGADVVFLWPSQVEHPLWKLSGGANFGYGTTYDDLFYHAFCIREGLTNTSFLSRCKRVLDTP
jgi:hypothetical protein